MFRSAKWSDPEDGTRGSDSGSAASAVDRAGGDTVDTRDPARAATTTLEVERTMDGSGEPGSYPFTPPDLDTDLMDNVRTGVNGPVASRPAAAESSGVDSRVAASGDPAQLAQHVAGIVQGLGERVRELEGQRQRVEQQLVALQSVARSGEALRQTLREIVSSSAVSPEDLQAVQRVLAALARDPNHIMVLASVAQHAGKFTHIVEGFARMHQALQQTPPA